jgi:hypothetical protein
VSVHTGADRTAEVLKEAAGVLLIALRRRVLPNGQVAYYYKGVLCRLGLLQLLGHHLLANLLLLNQKRSHNALSNAGVAARTAISTSNSLILGLGVLEPGGVHVLDLCNTEKVSAQPVQERMLLIESTYARERDLAITASRTLADLRDILGSVAAT